MTAVKFWQRLLPRFFVFWALCVPVTHLAAQNAGLQLRVRISGIEGELLDNARAYASIYQRRNDPLLNAGWVRHLHKQASKQIKKSLQPFGYYNAVIEATLEKNAENSWLAHYQVTTGTQARIAALDIQIKGEGKDEPAILELVGKFPLQPGSVLLHSKYETARDQLLTAAGDLGYHDTVASVHEILVDRTDNSAVIHLHIDTGDRYYLGEIRVHQDVLVSEFANRYAGKRRPGDRYTHDMLLDIQRDFIDSGYFSLVDVKPAFTETVEHRVPVDVRLRPAKRQNFAFGIGFNTDVGVNGVARWRHRRINEWGHNADALLRVSMLEYLLRGGYWIPILDPRYSKLGFTAKADHSETNTNKSDSVTLEAGYYQKIDGWRLKLSTSFMYESFTAGSESRQTSVLLGLGGKAEKSNIEEAAYPRHGWGLSFDLRLVPGLISSTSYLRAHVKSNLILPINNRGRLLLRGHLGGALVSDFDHYPASLRFFAGGDQSVRGFALESLGPRDSKGKVEGGRNLLTSSIEYNQLFTENWGAALFVDAGNAFNDDIEKVYVGAGVGARYLSPIGMVRVDVAWPMNKSDNDPELENWRLHFGFEVRF